MRQGEKSALDFVQNRQFSQKQCAFMAPKHPYYASRLSADEAEIVRQVESVIRAVHALRPDPDPAEVRKLYEILKPGEPGELEYVTIEEAT